MNLMDLMSAVILFLGGIVVIALMRLAVSILLADRNDYEHYRRKSGRWRDAIRGLIDPEQDGSIDASVSAGLAIDRKKKRWVAQGRLSEHAIDHLLRRGR